MDKILEQLNSNIKSNEKAISKQYSAIKKSQRDVARLEKANHKALMKINKAKIAEVTKMFNKTKRSTNMKIIHQNKKITNLAKGATDQTTSQALSLSSLTAGTKRLRTSPRKLYFFWKENIEPGSIGKFKE